MESRQQQSCHYGAEAEPDHYVRRTDIPAYLLEQWHVLDQPAGFRFIRLVHYLYLRHDPGLHGQRHHGHHAGRGHLHHSGKPERQFELQRRTGRPAQHHHQQRQSKRYLRIASRDAVVFQWRDVQPQSSRQRVIRTRHPVLFHYQRRVLKGCFRHCRRHEFGGDLHHRRGAAGRYGLERSNIGAALDYHFQGQSDDHLPGAIEQSIRGWRYFLGQFCDGLVGARDHLHIVDAVDMHHAGYDLQHGDHGRQRHLHHRGFSGRQYELQSGTGCEREYSSD